MRNDDASLTRCAFENLNIRSTYQLVFPRAVRRSQPRARRPSTTSGTSSLCQEGEVERLHAVILSSQVCSPLSTSAAYRNAAARPSPVS